MRGSHSWWSWSWVQDSMLKKKKKVISDKSFSLLVELRSTSNQYFYLIISSTSSHFGEETTMEEANFHLKPKKWLEDLSHGRSGHKIETLTLQGLHVVAAQKGFIRCIFFVPKILADRNGNWHTGAMATLMDDIGAAAIATTMGYIKASVNFNISCFSTVKVEEEVEIEAKVLSHKGKLSSVLVEVKRKGNGEMVALGKQWMTFIDKIIPKKASKL